MLTTSGVMPPSAYQRKKKTPCITFQFLLPKETPTSNTFPPATSHIRQTKNHQKQSTQEIKTKLKQIMESYAHVVEEKKKKKGRLSGTPRERGRDKVVVEKVMHAGFTGVSVCTCDCPVWSGCVSSAAPPSSFPPPPHRVKEMNDSLK